jgi:hypothetical protein
MLHTLESKLLNIGVNHGSSVFGRIRNYVYGNVMIFSEISVGLELQQSIHNLVRLLPRVPIPASQHQWRWRQP